MKLYIPLAIWQEMRGYALATSPNEITGLSTVMFEDENLVVDQIFVPYQRSNPAYCESEPGAINQIICNLAERDLTSTEALRFRWHSHAEGNVFWSATDEHDIAQWQASWVINLVMNTQGEYLARLDLFQDIHAANIPINVQIAIPIPFDVFQRCREEIAVKVQRMPFHQPATPDKLPSMNAHDYLAEIAHTDTLPSTLLKGGDFHETD